eukprot:Protomagalhaensia_sp_Gyna_25__2517@NODE_2419_length_1097_cov_70_379962_g1416_i1_p1_GENE_NODE_2419_length_1097_cov_70_379962_g1416_i1NODE_2419_length_1097_cov_70_379962_g1416_i1_p1_ORF_typecomplete_len202_score51_00TFIIA/PF03153_13/0_047_NODE_2419_length_1097_cov_70_379962_g1416_i1323928
MEAAGHRRIGVHLEEQAEEYEGFYDYSTSYKELHLPEKVLQQLQSGATHRAQLTEASAAAPPHSKATGQEDTEENVNEGGDAAAADDDEWESVEGEDVESEEELTWEERLVLAGYRGPSINSDGNLVLPDDVTVPHRKYWRQGKVVLPGRHVMSKKKEMPQGMIAEKEADGARVDAREAASRRLETRIRADENLRWVPSAV